MGPWRRPRSRALLISSGTEARGSDSFSVLKKRVSASSRMIEVSVRLRLLGSRPAMPDGMRTQKSNFGPIGDVIAYRTTFDANAVTFNRIALDDPALDGGLHHLKSHEQTLVAVRAIHRKTGQSVKPSEVVTWRLDREDTTEVLEGTVQNHFSRLKRDALVTLSDGAIPKKNAEEIQPGTLVTTNAGDGLVLSTSDSGDVLVDLSGGRKDSFLREDLTILF